MNRPALAALRATVQAAMDEMRPRTGEMQVLDAMSHETLYWSLRWFARADLRDLLDALLAPDAAALRAMVSCGACGEPAGGGHVCGAHARARGAQQARLDGALAAAGGAGLTDADLARWEEYSRLGAMFQHKLAPGDITELVVLAVPALIAEVRRLRAALHDWERSELPAHKDCTAEHCVATS